MYDSTAGSSIGLSSFRSSHVRLADHRQRRARAALESSLHAGQRRGLVIWRPAAPACVPSGTATRIAATTARDDAGPERHAGRAHGARRAASRTRRAPPSRTHAVTDCPHHRVHVLHHRPRAEDERRQIDEVERPVGPDLVPDGKLHERVGRDDEVARQPAARPRARPPSGNGRAGSTDARRG